MSRGLTVSQAYEQALQGRSMAADPAQRAAIRLLERIREELVISESGRGIFARLFHPNSSELVPGAYLWGGVGRGKTFVMDLFFDVLPFDRKLRLHFHRFMILIHEELHRLKTRRSPLNRIAKKYANRYRVICLDEMHITDEGDAAIMEGLLTALVRHRVTLVTTSNRPPHELCKDAHLRTLFIRAEEILQSHLTALNVDNDVDYRLRSLEQAELWHSPLNGESVRLLEGYFHQCSGVERRKAPRIIINERDIPVVKWADGVCWFDFEVICGPPRARIDYIEIARFFHTVLLQGVVLLDDENNDYARRFTLLVDELYDRNVKLIASAAFPIGQIYQGSRLAFEFQRTTSRLIEMQSHDYLAREHRP